MHKSHNSNSTPRLRMPPKRRRPTPLLIALAVTPAHYNSGVPHNADEVIAAKAICSGRRAESETFFSHTTNKEGSVPLVCQDFVKWLVRHTESPVCVVVGLDKFSNTALGRAIASSGHHLKVLDLASLAAAQALDLNMAISMVDTISHGVVHPQDGHIPPRDEVDFIVAQLKERFQGLLPLALRRQLHRPRRKSALGRLD